MAAGEKGRGFTLIELLVTMAVLVIMATIAIPNFQGMVERNKVAADYNEVLATLNYARSESVKRREDVAVNIYSGASGWVAEVKADTDDDGDLSDEVVVRSSHGGDDGVTVTTALVWFNPLGRRKDCSVTPCQVDVGGEVMEVNVAGNISKVN